MARQTRQRILDTSLAMFNAQGEPNVTTNHIADELEISPGNLYYHFKGKEELVRELFERFYEQFNVILRAPVQNPLRMEDNWFYLVVVFEHMHAYRFLYRNISLILQRYEQIQRPFRRLIHLKQDAARAICVQLRTAGIMQIDDAGIDMLARSIALTITYWFNFDNLLGDRPGDDEDLIHDGVLQALSLIAPHLGAMQREFMDTALAIHSRLGRAAVQATRTKGGRK